MFQRGGEEYDVPDSNRKSRLTQSEIPKFCAGATMSKFLLGFLAGAFALPLAILVIARLGLLPVNANTSPTRWESAFAHMALDASAAHQAPKLSNPIAPSEDNLMAGVKLFKNDCAGCHGTPNTAAANEANVN